MRSMLKYLRWLYSHSEGARFQIVMNIVLGLVNVGLNLLFIYLCKRIVDIATGVVSGSILTFSLLTVTTVILRLAVSAVNVRVENLTTSRMNFIIRKRIYSSLLQAEWLGKEKRHTGDMMNRLRFRRDGELPFGKDVPVALVNNSPILRVHFYE